MAGRQCHPLRTRVGSRFRRRKGRKPPGSECPPRLLLPVPRQSCRLAQAPTTSPALCRPIRRPPKLSYAGIPQQRALCSRLAVARQAPIKSLPARSCEQAPTCAPRTRKPSRNTQGLASLENLRAQPGSAFSPLTSKSCSQVFAGAAFSAIQISLTLYYLVL